VVFGAAAVSADELLSERFERLEKKVWRFEGRGEQRVPRGCCAIWCARPQYEISKNNGEKENDDENERERAGAVAASVVFW
jgi:hypothetical protein